MTTMTTSETTTAAGSGGDSKQKKPEMAAATSSFALRQLNTTVENRPIPAGVTRSDVHVDCQVSLERVEDKENKKRQELAEKIKASVEEKLRVWYPEMKDTSASSPYVVKVYVVVASDGDALNSFTFGLLGSPAEVCLEWFFQRAPGAAGDSETYVAGRVGERLPCGSGANDRVLVQRVTKKLVRDIVDKIGIANRSASMKVQS